MIDYLKKLEISVSSVVDRYIIESVLEQWAKGEGARVTPQGRLARRYKTSGNSMHWHIRGLRAGMGTVELTYLPDLGKLEVSVHNNRQGNWAGTAYLDLRKFLAGRFQ